MGLTRLIDNLVSEAARFVPSDENEGVLLVGETHREEVYQRFLDEGFVAVFRDGVDNPRPPNNKLYDIKLDEYFALGESRKELGLI